MIPFEFFLHTLHCICIHACTCTHTHTHTRTHTHTHTITHIYAHAHTYTHAHTQIYTHTITHTHTYCAHIYTCTHTNIYKHTRAHAYRLLIQIHCSLSEYVIADLPGIYTVEDVVDKTGFGLFQLGVTMFAGATWVRHVAHMYIYVVQSKGIIQKCTWDITGLLP